MVTKITIASIRGFERREITLPESRLILEGANGSGKTTVIELLHATSWGRSFRTSTPRDLVRTNTQRAGWRIAGETNAMSWDYTVTLDETGTRRMLSGASPVPSCREIWPSFLAITHTAERRLMVAGGPHERRGFLLSLACLSEQGRQLYRAYRLAYEQRASLIRHGIYHEESDTIWLENLWKTGIQLRMLMQAQCERIVAYAAQLAPDSALTLSYIPSGSGESVEQLVAQHQARYAREEYRARKSFVGPHRDEIEILYEGIPARRRASRGQQKLCAFILDAALASHALHDHQFPVLFACDDFQADFDAIRIEQALEIVERMPCQSIISVAPGELRRKGWGLVKL